MAAIRRALVAAGVLSLALVTGTPAEAVTYPTIPATGTFSFATANGILPTWSSENITLVGISPGSVVTSAANTTAKVSVPLIAKTGTANAAAGGFRLYNTVTGASVRCANPTIDTRARVVDCVLADGTNAKLFTIRSIGSRARVTGVSTITTIFRRIQLRINGTAMADMLNEELDTSSFSPYVTVGTGDLVVTRDR